MSSFSIYHWIVLALVLYILYALFARIVEKAGFPRRYALAALVPLVNIVALWLFAFWKWPVKVANQATNAQPPE